MKYVATWLALLAGSAAAHPTAGDAKSATRVRTVLAQKLPALDGGKVAATMVEVTYPPGGSSKAHSHPCPVMVYVVDGAVRMQVKGEPEKVYRAGETFFEAPDGVHLVSANASATAPAKFVAVAVCDRETAISVPVPGSDANTNTKESK